MITLTPSTTPVGGLTVYQKNLMHRMFKPELVTADVRLIDPDVLTLEEVSRRSKVILEDVKDRLPSQIQCISKRVGNVAIAARWPIVDGTAQCPDAPGLAVMQVEAPQGPLWIVALHLRWPYPHEQAAQLREVVPFLETLEGPIVLAGDFNMVPWSYALRQIVGATGSTRIGAAASSFPRFHPWVRLPIDHVFATGQGAIELRPLLGSDHYGIVARIELDAD
jgi:endonuclease/exonuclease/phosphatase (EEP) superfamily protein YafD